MNTVNAGQALGLSHPDHQSPLAVLVVPSAPTQRDDPLSEVRSKVALYLTDPEATLPVSDDALTTIYGLSQREARVAVAIANGLELAQIARADRVSVQTVRSQLKSIFRKTGVSRQVDLIRVLLGGPATCAAQPDSRERAGELHGADQV